LGRVGRKHTSAKEGVFRVVRGGVHWKGGGGFFYQTKDDQEEKGNRQQEEGKARGTGIDRGEKTKQDKLAGS
jgi:hypothetical protein